MKMKCL